MNCEKETEFLQKLSLLSATSHFKSPNFVDNSNIIWSVHK